MPQAGHTYKKTHKLSAKVLQIDTAAEEAKLARQAASAKTGRAAKTFVKEGRLRVTLIALRKGTVLSAHTVPGEVSIAVTRGAVEIGTAGEGIPAKRGAVVVLEAGVTHDVRALRDSALLITTSMR
jgi:quercetin dioxygenase-like cupin family protein